MKLHITCQYEENYGAHDWDGEGECPQRWKMKGGEDFFYQLGASAPNEEHLAELVTVLRTRIEWNSVGSRQSMVGYGLVADDFKTEYERSQLAYDGVITYPAVMLLPLEEVGVQINDTWYDDQYDI
jgi:hypothetical protein